MGADGEVLDVVKMPETPQDLLDFLEQYKDDSFCTLERVGGMPGNGGNAMFNFGKGYGHLQMALLALHIPTEDVTPNKWEKTYQLRKPHRHAPYRWHPLSHRKHGMLHDSNFSSSYPSRSGRRQGYRICCRSF